MKHLLCISFAISLIIGFAACAKNSTIKEGIYSGIYRGANQLQEVQALDDPPVVVHTPLPYDAYQRERLRIRSEKEDKRDMVKEN